MAFYLKKFSTHSEYNAYINGSGVMLPNVSICKTEGDVHYNPSSPVPPTPQTVTLTCVYVPTGGGSGSGSGGNSTQLFSSEFIDSIESMKIDGVEQPSVENVHDFGDTSEHTVTLNLKDGVTSIGFEAFNGCSGLTSIDIPNSVTSISGYAFNNCSGLTSCTIGSGVTSIGNYAFYYCTSLTSIVSNPTMPPTLGEGVFGSVGENGTLTVPSGSQGYCDWMMTYFSGWTIDGVTCGGSGSGA